MSWQHSQSPSHSKRDHSQMALSFHVALPKVCPLVAFNRKLWLPHSRAADECTPSLAAKQAASSLHSLQRPLFLFRFCHRCHSWKDVHLNVSSFRVTTHILLLCFGEKTTNEGKRNTSLNENILFALHRQSVWIYSVGCSLQSVTKVQKAQLFKAVWGLSAQKTAAAFTGG